MKSAWNKYLRHFGCVLLLGVGLLQPLGFMFDAPAVRGIGLATTASPLPLVFTHFRGFEPFAADYWVTLEMRDGTRLQFELTPEVYGKLGGPYNRRNPYGAVIAAGPKMTKPTERALWEAVINHGFCANGTLARDFMLAGDVRQVTITVVDQTKDATESWDLPWECQS